ncbi:hypothetical protein G6045_20040 [Streptomyces sp. YC504]|uniref:Uncharacterized protein n=1 Tax=Streptomyces mesophilus TaxID=1775132 RepID=A0A6G4XL34_9ACTN|nr:hypothetical protein [Streptomyces mesophilus]NGO77933.1 hypothetical protein [Streptomyces mesophilus]
MIPPTYVPALRHGLAIAALVLAVVAVIASVSGIGSAGREHHATDRGTEVHVSPCPRDTGADTGFHERDIVVP